MFVLKTLVQPPEKKSLATHKLLSSDLDRQRLSRLRARQALYTESSSRRPIGSGERRRRPF